MNVWPFETSSGGKYTANCPSVGTGFTGEKLIKTVASVQPTVSEAELDAAKVPVITLGLTPLRNPVENLSTSVPPEVQ